jgi:uncharacterized protein YyaL (SSP411 family)
MRAVGQMGEYRMAVLVALLGLLGGGAARGGATGVAEEPTSAPASPLYESYDPRVPALESYRDWPPDELLERFYGLPWSRLSFRRSELFGQPVFLVLTVDWSRAAQRLATEVLTDPDVLRMLNQGYISIVVNADLRPDVRERYQTGAWPGMAFLLPNGKPMLSEANDLGVAKPITTSELDEDTLLFLLREGLVYWKTWTRVLIDAGDRWADEEGPLPPDAGPVDASASELAARWLLGNADREDGGFGAAPKFLVPALDEYSALREARSLPALRRHSRLTLTQLVSSPLFDERDGGMHRLAAAPSFGRVEYEKMLTGKVQTLGRPGGGFYLAQGADPTSADGGQYWRGKRRGDAPPIDKLVLSGPNATAGAALVRAGMLLGDEQLVEAGRAALDLVLERGFRAGRGVGHVIEPMQDPRIYLSTQAEASLALLDAYEATGTRRYFEAARNIVDFAGHNLKDPGEPAYRDHLAGAFPLGLLGNARRPLRPNVRLARAMLRLALHGAGEQYREQAYSVLGGFCGDLASFGVHGVEAALAVEEAISEPLRIRISGAGDAAATAALRRAAVNSPWPWTLVIEGDDTGQPEAELIRGGETRRVVDADALHAAVLELAGEGGS